METVSSREESQAFLEKFAELEAILLNELETLKNSPPRKNDVPVVLSELKGCLDSLKTQEACAEIYLGTYDLRRVSERIKYMESQIREIKDFLVPKQAFRFSSFDAFRNQLSEIHRIKKDIERDKIDIDRKNQSEGNTLGERNISSMSQVVRISQKYKQRVTINVENQDVELADISCCQVSILGPIRALRMRGGKDSTFLIPDIDGSVHIMGCYQCELIISARQIRIHDSHECSFYVHVPGGPIIEDCTKVKFGPLSAHTKYNEFKTYADKSRVVELDNDWDQVKDFNWLRSQKSPHWDFIEGL